MGRGRLWILLPLLAAWAPPAPSDACSCAWGGPFLEVAREAPLVVRGTILRHHPDDVPTMDVLVAETLQGGLLDSGLVVQMGDGMHCRPALGGFPPGTEWILALNGPGSKPGQGLALSHCGAYWLRIDQGFVTGTIDGAVGEVQRMSLEAFRHRFLYPRFDVFFSGTIRAGERSRRPFGGRFEFVLEPMPAGWRIVVREVGREEDLARLTPPLHSAANPREIEGWHLLPDPSAREDHPYAADAGPEHPRRFVFSPDVGAGIDGPRAGRAVTPEEVEEVGRFGRGVLTIEEFVLAPGGHGCPAIDRLAYTVRIEGGL